MKVSEMLKVSEQTDKEICEQADKLAVEDYFEGEDHPKIEEDKTTIEPQESRKEDDWEVLQEEQKDEMISLESGVIYSTQDNRHRQMLLS